MTVSAASETFELRSDLASRTYLPTLRLRHRRAAKSTLARRPGASTHLPIRVYLHDPEQVAFGVLAIRERARSPAGQASLRGGGALLRLVFDDLEQPWPARGEGLLHMLVGALEIAALFEDLGIDPVATQQPLLDANGGQRADRDVELRIGQLVVPDLSGDPSEPYMGLGDVGCFVQPLRDCQRLLGEVASSLHVALH